MVPHLFAGPFPLVKGIRISHENKEARFATVAKAGDPVLQPAGKTGTLGRSLLLHYNLLAL